MEAIDPKLQPIIRGLQSLGFETEYSCQGNHLESGEVKIAYISFQLNSKLPDWLLAWVRDSNWQLLNHQEPHGVVPAIYSVGGNFTGDLTLLIQRNFEFVTAWQKLIDNRPAAARSTPLAGTQPSSPQLSV